MSDDALTYLLDRFATDAVTLRARTDLLRGKPAPEHGPDGNASREMAEACEQVIAMLKDLEQQSDEALLDALDALGPELHALSERAPNDFVRSVYGGAATRIEQVVQRARGDADDNDEEDDE